MIMFMLIKLIIDQVSVYFIQNTWQQLACALWRELHTLDASQASPAYLNALLSALTRLPYAPSNRSNASPQSPLVPASKAGAVVNAVGKVPESNEIRVDDEYSATARTLRSLRLVRELLLEVDLELFPKETALREPLLVLV